MFYEDDHFHPNNTEDDDFEFYHGKQDLRNEDNKSVHSNHSYRNKSSRVKDPMKMIDPGYHKITTMVGGRKVDFEFFHTSTTPGVTIRDAITGARCSGFRVGSRGEDQFFKVKLATGQVDGEYSTLFYDSPEKYERHMKVTVPVSSKEKWANKCATSRKLYTLTEEPVHDFVQVK
jgi:hypothetical protein